MPTKLVLTIRKDLPHPAMMRVSLANSHGDYVAPQKASYICNLSGRIWCYGKGSVEYQLPPGTFFSVASAGPSWSLDCREIQINGDGHSAIEIPLKRIFNNREAGWASADCHLHTWWGEQQDDFRTSFLGEDIDFAGIQYWALYARREHDEQPAEKGCFRIGQTWATSDEEIEMHSPWGPWEDSSIIGLKDKIMDPRRHSGYKMNAAFFREGKASSCRMIVYQAPTWAQFPVDAVLGLVDSVNICDNYYGVFSKAQGPWPYAQFSETDPLQQAQFGIASWIYQNYYRLLNAALKLPVSGGSAYPSGGGGGPIGLNRFYVEIGHSLSPDSYFANWSSGRTFSSNGPFLIAKVDGVSASYSSLRDQKEKTAMSIRIVSNRPVKVIEWIADGSILDRKELPDACGLQDVVWETEQDLRCYHWVAARCYGATERTFFPKGGHISPPFLTAHTSPFYLKCFGRRDAFRQKAVDAILEHLAWMRQVIEGKKDAVFASGEYKFTSLAQDEKTHIFEILNQARNVLNGQNARPPHASDFVESEPI